MAKSRFFRVGSVSLNAIQLEERLKENLRDEQERVLNYIQQLYVQELNKLLDDLRRESANRGMGFYAVRYNDPFEDADITVTRVRDSFIIRVENDRFNWLDEGRPEQQVTKTVKFPVYTHPTATSGVPRNQPGSTVIRQPAHIIALDGPARVQSGSPFRLERLTGDESFDNIFSDEQSQRWVTLKSGKTIALRRPRNFYLAVKKKVDNILKNDPQTRVLFRQGLVKTSIERR